VVSGYYDLVFDGETCKPVHYCFEFIFGPVVGEVAGVDEDVGGLLAVEF